MNKKWFYPIVVFLIIVIVGVIIYMAFFKKNETIRNFDLNNFVSYIERFPSEQVLGPTTSAEEAKEKAESVWIEIYGERVKDKKPYHVFFDDKNKTWLIQGSIPKNMLGGVPHIIIRQSDGMVLAVWHDK